MEPGAIDSPEHGFAIAFPGAPVQASRDIAGQHVQEFAHRSDGGTLYLVGVVEGSLDAREYLDQVPDLLPQGLEGEITSLTRAESGEHAGVEIVVRGPDGTHCGYRAFTTDARTYLVVCSGQGEDAVSGDEAQRFFDSFRILAGR